MVWKIQCIEHQNIEWSIFILIGSCPK